LPGLISSQIRGMPRLRWARGVMARTACAAMPRGLHEQGGIVPDQDTQVQAVSQIQVLLGLHKPHPSPRRAPDASEYSRGSSSQGTEATEAAA
jgi:hypothetical protein